jgi:dTDP-4-amino-4,6-dideoxygalactose transaminase
MQHFQAAMLLQQFDKLLNETKIRRENADYLTAELKEVPGITPARLPQDSRAVWHLYPLRYDPQFFHGLSRGGFIRALRAEGVPCGSGYHQQYHDGLLHEAITSRGFQRLFGKQRLQDYRDSLHNLPGNQQVCETTVGLSQNLLLAKRSDIQGLITAIRKIQIHSEALVAAST